MQRLTYFCLILAFASCAFAQSSSTDSTMKVLSAHLESLSHRADSLQAQLDKHTFREGYFTSELAEQTGIFAVGIAILLTAASLWTFNRFRQELTTARRAAETRYQSLLCQNIEFEKQVKEQMRYLNQKVTSTSANAYGALREIFEDKGLMVESLKCSLSGALAQCDLARLYKTEADCDHRDDAMLKCQGYLDNAKKTLAQIVSLPDHRNALNENWKVIVFHLDQIVELGDHTIRGRCAWIRSTLDEYLKQEPASGNA